MAVTLDLWSWLPVTDLALLRCRLDLCKFPDVPLSVWVPCSRSVFCYGSDVRLICCLLDLASASAEVTLKKSMGGIGFFFSDDVNVGVEIEVTVNMYPKVLADVTSSRMVL